MSLHLEITQFRQFTQFRVYLNLCTAHIYLE